MNCGVTGLRGRQLVDPTKPGTAVYLFAAVEIAKPKKPQKPRSIDPSEPRYLLVPSRQEANWVSIIVDVENDKWSYVQGGRAVNLPPRYSFTTKGRDTIFDKAKEYVSELFE
jgi:hypothetical protein